VNNPKIREKNMSNPTIGQYLALEKRVLRLEKFITDNSENLGESGMEEMLENETLTTYVRDYVQWKFYILSYSNLEQN